jgi:hypothetical protein
MKAKGREHAEWGFKKPNDGWHLVELLEGAGEMKKDGEIMKDEKGNTLYKIPAKINDESAEDHGADISISFLSATPFGEQKVADLLAAIGEFDNFEKAFPGDRSFFEQAIFDKIKIKTNGKFCKMRTETSKDGKYVNIVETVPSSYVPPVGKSKESGKQTAPSGTGKAAATDASKDW